MKTTIRNIAMFLGGLMVLTAAGCADVTVRQSPREQPAAHQTAPVDDGRPADQIRSENQSLRTRMIATEQRHEMLASQVEANETQKNMLKDQRKQVEKERDHYKKLLGKDDD